MVKRSRPWILHALALPVLSVGLSNAAVEVEEIGKQPVQVEIPSGGSLRMDLCSAGVKIAGGERNEIRVGYESPQDTGKVEVRVKTSGADVTLKVSHCPSENFRMTIVVPRATDLHVRMAAGELAVEGVRGSKDLSMHAGELTVDVGPAEDYASVDASVISGEVDAPPFNVNKGGLFRSFQRSGPGRYRLHTHVGAGQVTLR